MLGLLTAPSGRVGITSEAAPDGNPERPLTHLSDLGGRGLAMKATHICVVETCERARERDGYCNAHFKRVQKYGDPRSHIPIQVRQPDRGCSVDGCPRPHAYWGLCKVHGRALTRSREARPCVVDGCEKIRRVRGLCAMHAAREDRTGTIQPGPYAHGSPEWRFWRYVTPRRKDQCWEWRGGIGTSGYGSFNGGYAHRFSLKMHKGPAPAGKHYALHSCDNPICVNPAHLRWGSAKENMQDMIDRGRARWQKEA